MLVGIKEAIGQNCRKSYTYSKNVELRDLKTGEILFEQIFDTRISLLFYECESIYLSNELNNDIWEWDFRKIGLVERHFSLLSNAKACCLSSEFGIFVTTSDDDTEEILTVWDTETRDPLQNINLADKISDIHLTDD